LAVSPGTSRQILLFQTLVKQFRILSFREKAYYMEGVFDSQYADLLSVYKDYLSKIGVNLILDPKELAVFNSISTARTYKYAYFGSNHSPLLFNMDTWRQNQCQAYTFSSKILGNFALSCAIIEQLPDISTIRR
jgi:hypothetical protein